MILHIDLVFSYWIFLWYLLHILGFVKTNPKFALLLGLIENIILLIFMFFYSNNETIIYFILINFFIKIIPLYNLINTKITKNDIINTFELFIIYLLWLYVNKLTVTEVFKESTYSLLYNKANTPFLHFLKNYST